jgi:hypothetical protein
MVRRAVVRADPATGTSLWRFELDETARASVAPRRGSGRGVCSWGTGAARRIFYVTPGFQLVALQAGTGKPVTTFGTHGVVDLKTLLGVNTAAIGSSSPPLVFEHTMVIGPALEVGLRPASRNNRAVAQDAPRLGEPRADGVPACGQAVRGLLDRRRAGPPSVRADCAGAAVASRTPRPRRSTTG